MSSSNRIFAEKVYDELPKPIQVDIDGDIQCSGDNPFIRAKGKKPTQVGHDKHEYGKKGKKEGVEKIDWKEKLAEAYTYARLRGNVPGGIEQLIESLLYPKLNWKQILFRFVSKMIPVDFTWVRPNKHRLSHKFYFPSVLRERVEAVVHIDSSGSIGDDELRMFVSEVRGIFLQFNQAKVTLIMADCKVHKVYELTSEFDVKKVKAHGRRGTSHIPVFNYIKEHIPNCKILISFTDGFSEFPKEQPPYPVIWCLTKDHSDSIPEWGEKLITPYDRRW